MVSPSRTKPMVPPAAASGVADKAEYVMRAMAAATQSRYTFLTDDSGIGNPHAEPTVDCYVVTRLDSLVTRVLTSLVRGERVEPEGAVHRLGIGTLQHLGDRQDVPWANAQVAGQRSLGQPAQLFQAIRSKKNPEAAPEEAPPKEYEFEDPELAERTQGLALASLSMLGIGLVAWLYLHHRWPEIGAQASHPPTLTPTSAEKS